MTLAVALMIGGVVALAQDELVLRGGEPPPSGSVLEVTLDGVTVGSAVSSPVIVGWDRVRSVSGDHAGDALAFVDVADRAWRATSRLGRGDSRAAEPIYEELLITYRDRTGPTAGAVFEGLLRCRLRRNAQTLAVDAWLRWLRVREANGGPQWYRSRSTAAEVAPFRFDEATGLIPDLPPVWLDLPSTRVFAESPLPGDRDGSREHELAVLYQRAAAIAAGESEPLPRPSSSDPGVRLVWDLVAAQSAHEPDRVLGREALEGRLRQGASGWRAAWIRAALGRAMLREADEADQFRGAILLLTVYVRHDGECPYLAGLALAEAAAAVRDRGDEDGAASLLREFLDRFPGHPAGDWDRVRDWDRPRGAAARPVTGAPMETA